MVTTEINQMYGECSSWKNALREQRTHFGQLKDQLQKVSTNLNDKKKIMEIEHLQNLCYIQLINIHDLKHAIREHEQIGLWEKEKHGHVSDATMAAHDDLQDQFGQLKYRLSQVDKEYDHFKGSL